MFRFGHFSDIHFQYNAKTYDTSTIRDDLIDTLGQLAPLDAIFITGDIFFKGDSSPDQEKAVKEYIEEMAAASKCDTSKVFICAGNHDLKRTPERQQTLQNIIKAYKASNGNVLKTDGYKSLIYQDVVYPFNEICARITAPYEKEEIHRFVPLDDVNLIILNTSVFAGQTYPGQKDADPKLEDTNLFICDEKFVAFKKVVRKSIDKSKLTICLGHHGPDCFECQEKDRFTTYLDNINCDLYLCGHIHQVAAKIMDQTSETNQITCGGPFKDNEKYNMPSFVIGEYNPDTHHINTSLYYYVNSWQLFTQAFPKWKKGQWDITVGRLKKNSPVTHPPIEPQKPEKLPDVPHSVTSFFQGRDDKVAEVVKNINNNEIPIILVHGVAGIGKTEICKAAIHQLQKEDPDFSVPFIDLTGCENINSVLGRIAAAYGISISDIPPEKVFAYLCNQFSVSIGEKKPLAFLDNYEEVCNSMDTKTQNTLTDQLLTLAEKGLRFLISSQVIVNFPCFVKVDPLDDGINFQSLSWDQFKELHSAKLFCDVMGRPPKPVEKEAFKELIAEIQGHPLSLLLTAYSARGCASLKTLRDKWHQIEAYIPGYKEENASLCRALTLTWNSLKDNKAAILRWAIHSLSLAPLDNTILAELRTELPLKPSADEWDKASRALYHFGLIKSIDEDNAEDMLLAVKKVLSSFDPTAIDQALTAWTSWSEKTMYMGDKKDEPEHAALLARAKKYFPEYLYLIDYCLDKKRHEFLPALLKNIVNYLSSDSYLSASLLQRIIRETNAEELNHCELYWVLADSHLFLGRIGPATAACKKAEKLSREKQDKQSLAYALQTKGKILQHKGQVEDALAAYKEASQLFKDIDCPGGLADNLYYSGELFLRTGNLKKARAALVKSEKMHEQRQDNYGRAYALLSKGSILPFFCNAPEALKAYEEAKKLFLVEQEESGLATTLLYTGTLLYSMGRITEAMKSYEEAETIYVKNRNDYGIANILHDKGKIYHRLGQYDKAWEVYNKSEELFKESQDNFSRAQVLLSKGEWLKDNGQYSKAMNVFEQAKTTFIRESDEIGQSTVLQEIGDILTIKGQYIEASASYNESEKLCQKTQYLLGLAYLQKSRGELLFRQSRFSKAEKSFAEAEKMYRKGQFASDLAEIHLSKGEIQLKQKHYPEAISFLTQALRLFQKTQGITGQCAALLELEFCETKLGNTQQATKYNSMSSDLMSTLPMAVQRNIKKQFKKLVE